MLLATFTLFSSCSGDAFAAARLLLLLPVLLLAVSRACKHIEHLSDLGQFSYVQSEQNHLPVLTGELATARPIVLPGDEDTGEGECLTSLAQPFPIGSPSCVANRELVPYDAPDAGELLRLFRLPAVPLVQTVPSSPGLALRQMFIAFN